MRVWLITVGEPLPTDGSGEERLLRTGILADLIASRGDEVVYWSSTFDHAKKRHRYQRDIQIKVRQSYHLRLLHAAAYRTNVSLRRILNHRGVAQKFREQSVLLAAPDIILCSLPTLELCMAATDYGRRNNVPVVLDIRDLWPDLLLEVAPRALRWITRTALSAMFRQTRIACSRATAITGTTQEYVDWGLDYAVRRCGALDLPFPLGYVEPKLSDQETLSAEAYWRKLGFSRLSGEFVACWFGMMGRHSELNTIIEAAKHLSRSGRHVRFVLCGVGPKLEKYRRLAGSCPNVLFPGWVSAAQISTLLRIASIGLAPYVSNDNYRLNLPNKPIEYLSAGLPIVSSLQGVLARLLDDHDCGITYLNRRPDELARSIRKLYDQPNRVTTMAENAYSLYQSRFVADDVYDRMYQYLQSVAGQGSSRVVAPSSAAIAA